MRPNDSYCFWEGIRELSEARKREDNNSIKALSKYLSGSWPDPTCSGGHGTA